MKNQISLNIIKPCSEKFDQFSPTQKGGFCGSCQKEVIDFTTINAQEIVDYFGTKKTQNTCGRFKSDQLTFYSQKRKRISFLSGIGLACLSLLSISTAQAQEAKQQSESSEKKPSEMPSSKFQKDISVKGHVSEKNTPLPGVNVVLEGTTIGTQTNFDGDFVFPQKLKQGDVLIFSYIGLTTQKVVITDADSTSKIELKINMNMDSFILMGDVAVKKVYKSKRD